MKDASLTSRGVAIYFGEIRRFPMLKAEQEQALAERWRKSGDGTAAHQLLTSHLRLVPKIAVRYRGYGLPISDLVSEGNIGLINAMRRFDLERGVRFSTYANWWIKAAIQHYILRSWSLVKMGTTVNQKTLFFNLAKAKRRISALHEGDLHFDQVTLIANELGVTAREVVEMNCRLSGDLSLNAPLGENDRSIEWQDQLVDDGPDQEACFAESEEAGTRRAALGLALTVLDKRERHIFEARRLMDSPLKLKALADTWGISRERVRQIERHAFEKVQRAVHVACARKGAASSPICQLPCHAAA
jgi:RNA polymerase sigma-32 factor